MKYKVVRTDGNTHQLNKYAAKGYRVICPAGPGWVVMGKYEVPNSVEEHWRLMAKIHGK